MNTYDDTIKTHEPKMLIMCYDSGLLESRKIVDGKVMAAKPLYDDTVNDIFGHLHGVSKLKQWKEMIPNTVLYSNNEKNILIWTEPKGVRKLFFNRKSDTCDYALPRLVFKLKKNHLSVYATKGTTMNSVLYHAPFTNVSTSGVCMGSASLKCEHFQYWEDVYDYARQKFWNSQFTHEHNKYTRRGKNKKVYPASKLNPIGQYSYKISHLIEGKSIKNN